MRGIVTHWGDHGKGNADARANEKEQDMSTLLQNGDQFISSKEPGLDKAPGQNGYQGPSSLHPGQKAPRPQGNVAPPDVTVPSDDWQTRDVGKSGVKVHDSMANGSPSGKIAKNSRPVTKAAAKGNPV